MRKVKYLSTVPVNSAVARQKWWEKWSYSIIQGENGPVKKKTTPGKGQVQALSGSLNIVATLTSKYLQKVFF